MSASGWGADDRMGHGCVANASTQPAGGPRQGGLVDNAEEEARSPLAHHHLGGRPAAGDAEALRTDAACTSLCGDAVAHLVQKEGCGSLLEVPRSHPHTPSGVRSG